MDWLRRLALGFLGVACGPSFEVLQEGELRFAHCDRLDFDQAITPPHRLYCWREWERVYTFGQTRDRVEYARRRIAVLVSGDRRSPFDLPALGSAPQSSREPREVPLGSEAGPSQSCEGRCEAQHASCASGCQTKPTGCDPCERSLAFCLEDCR